MLWRLCLDLFRHFKWKIRGSHKIGTNGKERYNFQSLWPEPKILKPFLWYGNNLLSVTKSYPWHLSITNIFKWCMSFFSSFFFFLYPSKAVYEQISHAKTNSRLLPYLWITKLNKHFYEQHRISACETSVLECPVCFHSIVLFQCRAFSVLLLRLHCLYAHMHTH